MAVINLIVLVSGVLLWSDYETDLWPCPPAEKGPGHLVEIKSADKTACLDNRIFLNRLLIFGEIRERS